MSPSYSAAEPNTPNAVSSAYYSSIPHEWMRHSVTVRGSDPADLASKTLAALNRRLSELTLSAGQDNWDGMQSVGLSSQAVAHMRRLLSLLPPGLLRSPAPEIVPDPDGEIAIEWYISPSCLLSISVGSNGRLAWAGMVDGREIRNEAILTSQVPDQVLVCINSLIADRHHS